MTGSIVMESIVKEILENNGKEKLKIKRQKEGENILEELNVLEIMESGYKAGYRLDAIYVTSSNGKTNDEVEFLFSKVIKEEFT